MTFRPPRWLSLAAPLSSCFLALAAGTASLSRDLEGFSGPGGERVAEYEQRSASVGRDEDAFQEIMRIDDAFSVRYGFRNFNHDVLVIRVELPQAEVEAAGQEFGFRSADFKALDAWYQKAQQGAIDRSNLLYFSGNVTGRNQAELKKKIAEIKARNASVQAGLERTLADLSKEYRERRMKLYADAGFRYKDPKTVEADIPAMVRKNSRRMAPASLAFSRIVQEHGYGMEELVGAVTAMAQTSLRYEVPSSREGDRTVAGVLPPPKSFVLGQGDCDTKTALMGSILYNWPNLKLVGLGIPGHYLLAVHRIPGRGELFVEHQGLPYVMIEPAGPAWIQPGHVSATTEEYLKSGRMFAIQPF